MGLLRSLKAAAGMGEDRCEITYNLLLSNDTPLPPWLLVSVVIDILLADTNQQ